MLLWHLGLHEEADAIERAVEKSIALGITTKDIKRKTQKSTSTSKVGDFIADYITNQDDSNMNFKNIHPNNFRSRIMSLDSVRRCT